MPEWISKIDDHISFEKNAAKFQFSKTLFLFPYFTPVFVAATMRFRLGVQ